MRTLTRVKPGRHDAVAAAIRLAIKEAFDRRASGSARNGLIPAELASPLSPDARDRREAGREALAIERGVT